MTPRGSPSSPSRAGEPETVTIRTTIRVRHVALTVLLTLAVFATLWAAQAVFIPIVLALLVSYALDPVQRLLVKARLPRVIAASLLLVITVGGLGAGVYALRGQANAFISSLPDTARRVRATIRQLSANGPTAMTQVQRAAREIANVSAESPTAPPAPAGVTRVQVEPPPFSITDFIWKGTGGALAFAGQTLVVLVLVLYFLASGDLYKRKLVKIVGRTLSDKRLTVEILNDIEKQIERYLGVRLVISGIVAAATWIAFWWLGMPQPGVWGLGAGVLNVIPYVGPGIIAAGSTLGAFFAFESVTQALIVGATATAIATIEGFIITPLLMGKAGRMNGVAVFVSLSVWGFLWGLWGLLLAVPITMAIKVVCDHVEELKGVSELLGE